LIEFLAQTRNRPLISLIKIRNDVHNRYATARVLYVSTQSEQTAWCRKWNYCAVISSAIITSNSFWHYWVTCTWL